MCYVRVTYVWRMKCTRDVSTAYVLRSILICGVSVLYQLLFNTYENKLCSCNSHIIVIKYEPPHEKKKKKKKKICIGKNKGADQLRINCGPDQCLCFFSTWIVQFLYFLNPKFPASYHPLRLYRPVCVRSGRNPRCCFSHAQAHKRGRRCHRRNLDNLD